MGFIDNPRHRWFALAGLWAALMALGIWGFLQQASADGVDRPFMDTLYLTLQLATLDYDGSSGPMNWQLQIARFVAPVMAMGTVLQTASVIFRDQFRRYRLRYAKGAAAWVEGTVTDLTGRPVNGAQVEIWQCDEAGHYHHPQDGGAPAPPADADSLPVLRPPPGRPRREPGLC